MVPGKLTVICNLNNGSLGKAVVASNSISFQHARQLKYIRHEPISVKRHGFTLQEVELALTNETSKGTSL
jgi:hypothetical protein